MSDEPLVDIRNGKKSYGRKIALRMESLQVMNGDRIIVSGENGSGKSTLLRIIAGMTEFDEGAVGRSSRWRDLLVGYLPQEGGVYRDLTIAENQQAFCRLLGQPTDPTRAEAIAEQLGVSRALDQAVGELSGGFRRLAAIHCLLSTGANALVLDEPFASLDAAKQSAVRGVIQSLVSDYVLLVISEHMEHALQITEGSLWSKALWLKRAAPDVSPQA